MFQGTFMGDKPFSLMLFSEFLDLRAVSQFWQLWSLHGTAGDMVKVKGGIWVAWWQWRLSSVY